MNILFKNENYRTIFNKSFFERCKSELFERENFLNKIITIILCLKSHNLNYECIKKIVIIYLKETSINEELIIEKDLLDIKIMILFDHHAGQFVIETFPLAHRKFRPSYKKIAVLDLKCKNFYPRIESFFFQFFEFMKNVDIDTRRASSDSNYALFYIYMNNIFKFTYFIQYLKKN